MKKVFILFVGFLLVLGAYGYWQAINQGDRGAKIVVEPEKWDFGEVSYGQVVKKSFEVKNVGQAILEIKRVATSCGCTEAKLKTQNSKLKPGEETELIVTYDTGAMSGFHAKGRQERIIYIKSNDPDNPQLEVTIYADVK